jgi:glycosyltransferase involved in cell wall biosynthesis
MKTELSQRLPLIDRLKWQNHIHAIYSIVNPGDSGHNSTGADPMRRSDKKHLLYVAAFSRLKGQLPFIERALPGLARAGYVIHFVGDFKPDENEYARACADAVARLQLEESCIFHGYTSNVGCFYEQALLTLVISAREGLSRCMIESLAYGTPVVSFDVCSAAEILHGYKCGLVAPVGDYETLVRNIETLAINTSLREEYAAAGRQVARSLFTKEHIVSEYEKLYLQCGQ